MLALEALYKEKPLSLTSAIDFSFHYCDYWGAEERGSGHWEHETQFPLSALSNIGNGENIDVRGHLGSLLNIPVSVQLVGI